MDKKVLLRHLQDLDLWDEIISMADERWSVGDNAVDDLVFCAIDCIYFEEDEVAGDDEATRCMRVYDEYGEDKEVIALIVSLATQKSTKEARAKAGEFWSAITGS